MTHAPLGPSPEAHESPALGWYTIAFGPERIEVKVVHVRDVAVGLRAHPDQAETRVFWQRRSGRFRVGMSLTEWHTRKPTPLREGEQDATYEATRATT